MIIRFEEFEENAVRLVGDLEILSRLPFSEPPVETVSSDNLHLPGSQTERFFEGPSPCRPSDDRMCGRTLEFVPSERRSQERKCLNVIA